VLLAAAARRPRDHAGPLLANRETGTHGHRVLDRHLDEWRPAA